MFADQSLPKCNKDGDIADAMVQMISVRTKIAVWIFLLIGTWFIYEIEYNEIWRFASEHGWFGCFLHTESMLQRLQNLSSFLLFPCAVSMCVLHATQHVMPLDTDLLGWLTYSEYLMSICLTGWFM